MLMKNSLMYRLFFKRFLDICLSSILIIITSPLMAGIYFLVRKELGSPVIFTQPRPGLDEKIFYIYKFRSMSQDELDDELRLNEFGKKFRKSGLDEILQLFNVLKGDMSLIGPRPLLVEYLPLYSQSQSLRHKVRPGITGLAQVNGRNNLSWEKKFQYDIYYVEKLSFILDIKIAYLTLKNFSSNF